MWAGLLLRVWPYLAGAALLIGAAWLLHHHGYESGYAASEALWQPRFAQAESARDAANEKARRQEEDSKALTDQTETQHAQTVASLTLRAVDADQRIRTLSLRIATASASRCEVPAVPGTATVSDAATAGAERAERAGASIADVGRRCELDAVGYADLQRWVTAQRGISLQR